MKKIIKVIKNKKNYKSEKNDKKMKSDNFLVLLVLCCNIMSIFNSMLFSGS